MATNFGANATEAPQVESAIPVVGGVVKPSPSVKEIDRIFGIAGGILDGNIQKKKDTVVNEFLKKQLLVADALAQGSPSVPNLAYAQTVLRKNLLEALDANPNMAAELLATQNTLNGLPGAEVLSEGTQNEQEWNRIRTSLIDSGDITPDDGEDKVRSAWANRQKQAASAAAYQAEVDAINLELKRADLDEKQRSALEGKLKDTAYEFARTNAKPTLDSLRKQLEKITESGASPAEQQAQIEDMFIEFEMSQSELMSHLDESDRSVFRKPFEDLRDAFIKRATGQYALDDAKRQVDLALAQTEALLYADPKAARIAVLSKAWGSELMLPILGELMGEASTIASDYVAYGTSDTSRRQTISPYVESAAEKTAFKAYISGATNMALHGKDEEKVEGIDRVKTMLSSVADYQSAVQNDPTGSEATIEIVNWLASSEFQQVIAANPELREDVDAAREALNRHYWDDVASMVQEEFTKNKITKQTSGRAPPEERATTDVISAISDETGIRFVAKDPRDGNAVNKATDLNKTLRPVLNTQIRAAAHLNGRTDYGAYWEETKDVWLDMESEDQSSLELSDFTQLAALTSNYGSLVSLVDETEGAGSYDTLLNHQQREGGKFEGVSISNMSIGEVINFSSGGGEYAEYSKGAVGRMATPMGRYQIVGATLKRVASAMGLDPSTPFNQATQDAMFAFLVQEALRNTSTLKSKRVALRGVWEGFKNASNEELDAAIEHFEG